jgi:hypothetical protein
MCLPYISVENLDANIKVLLLEIYNRRDGYFSTATSKGRSIYIVTLIQLGLAERAEYFESGMPRFKVTVCGRRAGQYLADLEAQPVNPQAVRDQYTNESCPLSFPSASLRSFIDSHKARLKSRGVVLGSVAGQGKSGIVYFDANSYYGPNRYHRVIKLTRSEEEIYIANMLKQNTHFCLPRIIWTTSPREQLFRNQDIYAYCRENLPDCQLSSEILDVLREIVSLLQPEAGALIWEPPEIFYSALYDYIGDITGGIITPEDISDPHPRPAIQPREIIEEYEWEHILPKETEWGNLWGDYEEDLIEVEIEIERSDIDEIELIRSFSNLLIWCFESHIIPYDIHLNNLGRRPSDGSVVIRDFGNFMPADLF